MMVTAMLFLSFFLFLGLLTYAQSSDLLGGFPLAVKTPYLHSWISNTDLETAPEKIWPTLFTQNKILGWNGMIRVDDIPYQWLGDSSPTNFSTTVASGGIITPTTTIFTIHAGQVRFNVTFFSPVEPDK